MSEFARRLSSTMRKPLMFLLVGGSAAGFYALSCTFLLSWLPGWRATISIGVHASLIPIVFFVQRRLTFRSTNPALYELAKYAGLQISSICISTTLLVRLVTQNPYLNVAIFLMIAGLAAIISYSICNLFIFKASRLCGNEDPSNL